MFFGKTTDFLMKFIKTKCGILRVSMNFFVSHFLNEKVLFCFNFASNSLVKYNKNCSGLLCLKGYVVSNYYFSYVHTEKFVI